METLNAILKQIDGIVWGPGMLILILGVGLFLSIGLKLMPTRKIGYGFKLLLSGQKAAKDDESKGEIPPFQALMTALSATVGTGNIAGVATAIVLGGPGALFWMWLTALVGMATKYSEAVLAVHFRETDKNGQHVGGPMYYIKNGLGNNWKWLGVLFAIFGACAGFGIGNTVQSNSVADALEDAFNLSAHTTHFLQNFVDPIQAATLVSDYNLGSLLVGLVLMVLVGSVLLGGIKRIGSVASALVPVMAITYIILGLIALIINVDALGSALELVFTKAFSLEAGAGGAAGATMWAAIHYGVARGVFSNEAGLGSAPIAHAAAQTHNPVRQGLVAMLGTFIDTILVCTITGLVIISSGVWDSGDKGSVLTSAAFQSSFGEFGSIIVSIALAVFAFTTIIGWSFYGEKCVEFLFGIKAIKPYRLLWLIALPVGAAMNLGMVWTIADILNAMMAIPNLIALALLSGIVFRLTRKYFQTH